MKFFLKHISSNYSPSGGQRLNKILSVFILVLALITSFLVADGRYGFSPDGITHLNTALNIVEDKGLVKNLAGEQEQIRVRPIVTKPPLYQFAIATQAYLGFFSVKVAGWVISQAAFIISAVLIFLLALKVLPAVWAVTVGILFCFLISILKWSIFVKEDSLYMMFSFAALLLFVHLKKKPKVQLFPWLIVGILTGAAVLTRYIGITLLAALSLALMINHPQNKHNLRRFWFYICGVALIGFIPFVRFIILWGQGSKPAFFEAAESTWFEIISGVHVAFQRDFTGQAFVWLYDKSPMDILIVIVSVLAFIAMLCWAMRQSDLMPAALYVLFYLAVLVVQLATKGFYPYEHRYNFPVEGLILLFIAFIFWSIYKSANTKLSRYVVIALAAILVVVYTRGQWRLYNQFKKFPSGPYSSREYCPSPESIGWMKNHIPKGEIIIGGQCTRQFMAETNKYFWLPIPPANEYRASARYKIRWQENDFIRISEVTGAKWVVLLTGEQEDPLLRSPGYGSFVSSLFAGEQSQHVHLKAKFSDGLIYKIE